jgi:hypothetical protein
MNILFHVKQGLFRPPEPAVSRETAFPPNFLLPGFVTPR